MTCLISQIHPVLGRQSLESFLPLLSFLMAPPPVKWNFPKDPDGGKDGRQEEKGATEDKMVGWHHRINGQEFEQTLGDGEGQGSLAGCSPRGRRVRDD